MTGIRCQHWRSKRPGFFPLRFLVGSSKSLIKKQFLSVCAHWANPCLCHSVAMLVCDTSKRSRQGSGQANISIATWSWRRVIRCMFGEAVAHAGEDEVLARCFGFLLPWRLAQYKAVSCSSLNAYFGTSSFLYFIEQSTKLLFLYFANHNFSAQLARAWAPLCSFCHSAPQQTMMQSNTQPECQCDSRVEPNKCELYFALSSGPSTLSRTLL